MAEQEAMIKVKFIELINLAVQHGIDTETLMYKALDHCHPKPP